MAAVFVELSRYASTLKPLPYFLQGSQLNSLIIRVFQFREYRSDCLYSSSSGSLESNLLRDAIGPPEQWEVGCNDSTENTETVSGPWNTNTTFLIRVGDSPLYVPYTWVQRKCQKS